jgi:hypothetical protein
MKNKGVRVGIMGDVFSFTSLSALDRDLDDESSPHRKQHKAIADEFGDTIWTLPKYYLAPRIQPTLPAEASIATEKAINSQAAESYINTFFSTDALHNDGSRHLFLLADAGMGKTSLMIMVRLLHLQGKWASVEKCELLCSSNVTEERLSAIREKGNTVLLIDALDEDPLGIDRIDARITELIDLTQSFSRVIISCRSQYIPPGKADVFGRHDRQKFGSYTVRVAYLSYFTNAEVQTYLEKRFSNLDKRQRAAEIVINFKSLQFRPLLLSYIDKIMDSPRPPSEWNEHAIFTAMIHTWLSLEVIKLRTKLKDFSILEEDIYSACERLALWLNRKQQRSISNDDFRQLCENDSDMMRVSMLKLSGRSLLNWLPHAWQFAHFSVQEYLVAEAVANGRHNSLGHKARLTDEAVRFLAQSKKKGNVINDVEVDSKSLHGLRVANTKLRGCVFRNCNFNGIDLSWTEFSKCEFYGCDAIKAVMTFRTSFSHCGMAGLKLSEFGRETIQVDEFCKGFVRPQKKVQNTSQSEIVISKFELPDESGWNYTGGP